jgi:hypothetical protein
VKLRINFVVVGKLKILWDLVLATLLELCYCVGELEIFHLSYFVVVGKLKILWDLTLLCWSYATVLIIVTLLGNLKLFILPFVTSFVILFCFLFWNQQNILDRSSMSMRNSRPLAKNTKRI